MTENIGVNEIIDTISIKLKDAKSATPNRYKAIAAILSEAIRNGLLETGIKLPTHRFFADKIGVTPGTISRAYAELEKLGLVAARVGDGTYVRDHKGTDRRQFQPIPSNQPGVTDLSLNFHISHAEVDPLSTTLQALSQDSNCLESLMNYQPDAGNDYHRQAGVSWLQHQGIEGNADNILVTNGAQHALLCALMATTRPGSIVAAEALCYPGLITAARYQDLRLRGISIDEQGMVPEALDEACSNTTLRTLFCTPNIHNPTTATMQMERRRDIVEVARRHNLIIIEDDVHGTLAPDNPASLQSLAPERTLYISSLTKAVASGLRVGYLLVPPEIRMKASLALRASCWMATPLSAEIAARWINDGTADRLIADQQHEILRRKALIEDSLLPFSPASQPYGLHYWIPLPEPWRAIETADELRQHGVLIKPSDAFSIASGNTPQAIRVSISGPTSDEELIDGIGKVRDLLTVGL